MRVGSVLGATRSCSGVLLSEGLMRRAASMAERDLDLPTLWLRKRNWHARVRLGAAWHGRVRHGAAATLHGAVLSSTRGSRL